MSILKQNDKSISRNNLILNRFAHTNIISVIFELYGKRLFVYRSSWNYTHDNRRCTG